MKRRGIKCGSEQRKRTPHRVRRDAAPGITTALLCPTHEVHAERGGTEHHALPACFVHLKIKICHEPPTISMEPSATEYVQPVQLGCSWHRRRHSPAVEVNEAGSSGSERSCGVPIMSAAGSAFHNDANQSFIASLYYPPLIYLVERYTSVRIRIQRPCDLRGFAPDRQSIPTMIDPTPTAQRFQGTPLGPPYQPFSPAS